MKQCNFYSVSHEEEQALVDYLRKKYNVKIVMDITPVPELDIRENIPVHKTGDNTIYLWDADHSPPPVNKFIPEQNYYLVNQFETEAIILDRCDARHKDDLSKIAGPDDLLGDCSHFCMYCLGGRIAIDYKFWRGEELIERPKYFLDFFESARRWIKKNSVYSLDIYYVLPSVVKFIENGGIIVQQWGDCKEVPIESMKKRLRH